MKKKLYGSAMLWSVCTLLIVMVIVTGILFLNKMYAREEITNFEKTQAEYYARSGIDVTAKLIEKKEVVPVIDKTVKIEYDWCTVSIAYTLPYRIEIVADAEVGESSERMSGLMTKSGDQWTFKGYVTY